MNITMQQPVTFPFYMSSPRLPFSVPWTSNPFHFPPPSQPHYPSSYQTSSSSSLPPVSYSLPFVLPHQPPQNHPPSKTLHTSSSYTNTRYNHLKQSTSHFNRQRFPDTSGHSQRYVIPNHQYRPLRTKSVTDLHQYFHQNSPHLPKAHSWHAINYFGQPNYPNEMSFNHPNPSLVPPPPPPPPPPPALPRHQHQYSPKQKKKTHRRHLSSSPQITSDHGVVRISTVDELPIMTNPIYQDNVVDPNRTPKLNETIRNNFTKQTSPSTSNSSHASLQKRLNGSLRNDPLLSAAMDDFRQLRQTPSQRTSLTSRRRDLSRDSLCSSSTHRSTSSISRSRSRSRSQSSFTSLERLEIRRLIKTFKTKDLQTLNKSLQISSVIPPATEKLVIKRQQSSSTAIIKPKKSSITEELDRQFRKIRSTNPNEDLIYVKPSLIQKDKTSIPSLPSFDELLYKSKSQTVETTTTTFDEKTYENPLVTVSVPESSPILSAKLIINENKPYEIKPDYTISLKHPSDVNLRSNRKEDQIRSFSFCKPMNDIVNDNQQTRPVSMLNWLQYGLTNPLPTTFQPHKILTDHENSYDNSLVKENIYASDIDVHIPLANNKEYLQNQTLIKDYLADCKHSAHHPSIFNDFSRLFTRFGNHKHEQKSKLKTKLPKNNNMNNNNNNNVRCSIM